MARNFRSVKQTIKRLEEASVSCRGPERIQLMRRWLAALKETDRFYGGSFDDKEKNSLYHNPSEEMKDNLKKPPPVSKYYFA